MVSSKIVSSMGSPGSSSRGISTLHFYASKSTATESQHEAQIQDFIYQLSHSDRVTTTFDKLGHFEEFTTAFLRIDQVPDLVWQRVFLCWENRVFGNVVETVEISTTWVYMFWLCWQRARIPNKTRWDLHAGLQHVWGSLKQQSKACATLC